MTLDLEAIKRDTQALSDQGEPYLRLTWEFFSALVAEVERLWATERILAKERNDYLTLLRSNEVAFDEDTNAAVEELDRWVTVADGLAATLRDMRLGMCHPSWQWLCAYDALVAVCGCGHPRSQHWRGHGVCIASTPTETWACSCSEFVVAGHQPREAE